MRRRFLIASVVLLCAVVGVVALAEDSRRADAMKRIEMIRIWRLTEFLDLSVEDAGRIFPILQRYDKQFQDKREAKEDLVQRISDELNGGRSNSAQLSRMTSELLKLEEEAMTIRKQMFAELKEAMTPEQLARYMMFEVHFQQEMDDIFSQVRRDRPLRGAGKILRGAHPPGNGPGGE